MGRAVELFASNISFVWSKQMRAFNCSYPPPEVIISICIPKTFNPKTSTSYELIYLCKDPFTGESCVLLRCPEG